MYGFGKDDIERGIDAVGEIPPKVKESILENWERNFDGYRFHPSSKAGLFNPTQAMYNFQMLRNNLQRYGINEHIGAGKSAQRLLTFLPDPNTMPAESTLRIIAQHPLGRATIRNALRLPSLLLSSSVLSRFRLSSINELSTNTDALLSFMFYTGASYILILMLPPHYYLGALTYCAPPDDEPRSSGPLKVTNETARKEFWDEALRMSPEESL